MEKIFNLLKMRVLLTGSTGLLGKACFETKPKKVQLHGLYFRKNSSLNPKNFIKIDIRNKKCVDKLFKNNKYDAVIHAAGIASVDYVKNNYAESLESNIVGTLNISSACRKNNVFMIYISSNAVFDGFRPPYHEESKPNPVNEYGQIKLECEKLIEKTLPTALICRPILMYGWNHHWGRPNPVTWLLNKLIDNTEVKIVTDVWENPIYNLDCAKALWSAVALKPSGKMHLAGPEVISRYELAIKTVEIFGLNPALITPVKSNYFSQLAKRPKNTSFSIDKMSKYLKISPLTVQEGLLDMKKNYLKMLKTQKT
jgi:dTDP-4-dehydrorhamnose reductase